MERVPDGIWPAGGGEPDWQPYYDERKFYCHDHAPDGSHPTRRRHRRRRYHHHHHRRRLRREPAICTLSARKTDLAGPLAGMRISIDITNFYLVYTNCIHQRTPPLCTYSTNVDTKY